ncbi:hypothetical protein K3177_14745 [Qipengyuania sp. GH25]|uniref:Uncharacterized protein n=1 Tax=Qipengyuania pacifica TaxID=2860199 RepID=A0ABS7JK55_9SPHN|nr:hypothetical protein [Qipengyuania aerophila]MBX7489764.1 hypothetical protein [Qipengyuania aerophila]
MKHDINTNSESDIKKVAEPIALLVDAGIHALGACVREHLASCEFAKPIPSELLSALRKTSPIVEPKCPYLYSIGGTLVGEVPLIDGCWIDCLPEKFEVFVRLRPPNAIIGRIGRPLEEMVSITHLSRGHYKVSDIRVVDLGRDSISILTCNSRSVEICDTNLATP